MVSRPDYTSAITDSGGSTGDYVYVEPITWDQDYIRGRNPNYSLDAFITILDNSGNSMVGAVVTIDWTFLDGGTQTMYLPLIALTWRHSPWIRLIPVRIP